MEEEDQVLSDNENSFSSCHNSSSTDTSVSSSAPIKSLYDLDYIYEELETGYRLHFKQVKKKLFFAFYCHNDHIECLICTDKIDYILY